MRRAYVAHIGARFDLSRKNRDSLETSLAESNDASTIIYNGEGDFCSARNVSRVVCNVCRKNSERRKARRIEDGKRARHKAGHVFHACRISRAIKKERRKADSGRVESS